MSFCRALAALLLLLVPAGAQAASAVSLGTATCFAVLTGDPGASIALTGSTTTIRGSVGLGPSATQNFSAGSIVGQLLVDPTAMNAHSNTVAVAGGTVAASLQQPLADAAAAAAAIAAMTPTQTFGAIAATMTIAGNGGINVIAVSSIALSGTATLTLSGGPGDFFYVQVAGAVRLSQSAQIVLAGVPAANVAFNLGGGGGLAMSGTSVASGTFLAFGRAASRAISISHAALDGAILTAAKSLTIGGGASVTPPCIPPAQTGPIAAPAGKWTFVPFWDAFCANGTTTGIGVNLAPASTKVLIYLEGGGACWNYLTCDVLMTASYVETGYGPKQFKAELAALTAEGSFFSRTAAGNPFRDYNFVYVPYCTGDVHAGRNVARLAGTNAPPATLFFGASNFAAYLERIVATFPAADHVVLAGSSAGGFGAVLNWGQTQQAFGSVAVDMIDDSGTFMPPSLGAGLKAETDGVWNVAASLPPECTACAAGLDALFGYYAQAFPDDRGALLSYTEDTVLPSFFGISEAQFTEGLDTVLQQQFEPNANLHYFVDAGQGHVLLFDPTLTSNGESLATFLTKMVTGEKWGSVGPKP